MRALLIFVCLAAVAAEPLVYIDLAGPWRIAHGDNPQFASPNFDDSAWKSENLPVARVSSRTQSQAIDPMHDSPEEFFWLRRTVELPSHAANARLALTVGAIREGYQVFVNGALVGATGPLEISKLQIARPRVFDRFFRAGDALAETGSGLGLAIVKTIADRHGAFLRLDESARLGGLHAELRMALVTPLGSS